MTSRFYILPLIGIGTMNDQIRPAYLDGVTLPDVSWGIYWGRERWGFYRSELQPVEHNALVSYVDVFAFPVNLDVNLTRSQVSALRTKLESMKMPGDWVSSDLTWRNAGHTITAMCTFMNALLSLGRIKTTLFTGGVTLDTLFGALSPELRPLLMQTIEAQRIGLAIGTSYESLTFRKLLILAADGYKDRTFNFGLGVDL